jgi:hypothetical protein
MHENETDKVAQVPSVQEPASVSIMPNIRLQNNSALASNPSKLATTAKIRAGVTQFLQPSGNIQSIRLSTMGDIEKQNDAGRAHDIDLNRLVYEVEIKYPEYTDIKVGTFVNAKMVSASIAKTEELLFRSITGKSKAPDGFIHPGILPNNQ